MTEPIQVNGLVKTFKRHRAIDGISFDVPEGSVFGFLGPNGAGKTTTIRVLLGLIRPDSGTVVVNGINVRRSRIDAVRGVGAIVETPALYPNLTGRENLAVACRLLGAAKHEIPRVLEIAGLEDASGKLVRKYSLGMRQRLGLARALIGEPRLLILDEPTNGLDPAGIRDMRALIRELPQRVGATVLVSSHLLGEIEQIATHVAVMDAGTLLFSGALESMLKQHESRIILGTYQTDHAAGVLSRGGFRVSLAGAGRLAVAIRDDAAPRNAAAKINRFLLDAGIPVDHLEVASPSLEDLFLGLTGGAATPPSAEAGERVGRADEQTESGVAA